jgi:uncharacterized protein YjdB
MFGVCEGLTTVLSSAPGTGAWSITDPAVATIGAGTGVLTGVSAYAFGTGGVGQTTVTYTLGTGCIRTQDVTVNPLPGDISGVSDICVGDMVVLGTPSTGGSWISSDPTVATVDAVGIVTGVAGGNVIISYVLPTGCLKTWPMTVNNLPDAITGSLTVCAGFATNLTSGPAGGVWSSDPALALTGSVNPVTGVFSAYSGGTVTVSYTLGSGCNVTAVVTVITLPPTISGVARACEAGGTTTLIHSVPGGVWSISNPAIASIDAGSGLITGIVAGTAVVTYTVGTGCFNVHTVTIDPLPAMITGPSPLEVCAGSTILLANASAPLGGWISDATDKATIGTTTGILTGVQGGIAPIRYVMAVTGCQRTVFVTVNNTPGPIIGNPHICMGGYVTYHSDSLGGIWSISDPTVANLIGISGNVATAVPVSLGVATITYAYPVTGCMAVKSVTVQPLPVVYNVTGGGNLCAGAPGVAVGLDGSQAGVSYVLYRGATAAGYLAGSGFPLGFGLMTTAGTYTVQATNATSGCQRNMAGSAVVTVTTPATPVVTITSSPSDSVCPGEAVMLTPTPTFGGTAPTYVWKVNGVTVGIGGTYSFVPANGDVASITMTSNSTCLATTTATGSKTLTVLPVALPVAGVLVSPNDTVCEFTPVVLTGTAMYGGSAPSFTWYVNGSAVGSGPTYTYVPTNGQIVSTQMISNYRCRLKDTVTSEGVVLTVDPILVPHVVITASPGLNIPVGTPVTLTAIAYDAGPSPSYQWKVNGYPVAGATEAVYTAVFNDYDSIIVEVVSDGVCHNIGTSDWVFITTDALGVSSTGGVSVSDIRLLPNPNRGTFTVRGSFGNQLNGDVPVDITNVLGQVVYRGMMRVAQGKVDAQIIMDNTLANGMYMLTLRPSDGQQTFHFVLER